MNTSREGTRLFEDAAFKARRDAHWANCFVTSSVDISNFAGLFGKITLSSTGKEKFALNAA
jgi:hypothetical protein